MCSGWVAQPVGISAAAVSLTAYNGSVGDGPGATVAPVVVSADTVNVLSSATSGLTSSQSIDSVSITQYNSSLPANTTWSVATPDFNLSATGTAGHAIDVTAVTGADTDLSISSQTNILVGVLESRQRGADPVVVLELVRSYRQRWLEWRRREYQHHRKRNARRLCRSRRKQSPGNGYRRPSERVDPIGRHRYRPGIQQHPWW